MAQTKRAQVLMEPLEYERLEEIARQRGTSVGELFRTAVRRLYLVAPTDRLRLVEELTGMNVPLPPWEVLEEEIAQAHDEGAG